MIRDYWMLLAKHHENTIRELRSEIKNLRGKIFDMHEAVAKAKAVNQGRNGILRLAIMKIADDRVSAVKALKFALDKALESHLEAEAERIAEDAELEAEAYFQGLTASGPGGYLRSLSQRISKDWPRR